MSVGKIVQIERASLKIAIFGNEYCIYPQNLTRRHFLFRSELVYGKIVEHVFHYFGWQTLGFVKCLEDNLTDSSATSFFLVYIDEASSRFCEETASKQTFHVKVCDQNTVKSIQADD